MVYNATGQSFQPNISKYINQKAKSEADKENGVQEKKIGKKQRLMWWIISIKLLPCSFSPQKNSGTTNEGVVTRFRNPLLLPASAELTALL